MNKYRIAKHIRKDGGAYYSIENQSDDNLNFWQWYLVNDTRAHYIPELELARGVLEEFREKVRRADRAQIVRVEYIDS